MLWDSGTWLPKEEPAAGYRKGRLKFELKGEKLRGGWMLVRTRGDRYRGDRSWLLIKEDDEYARPAAAGAVVEDEPDSVTTGRSLEEIAEGADRVWHSNQSVAQNVRAGAIAPAGSRRKRKPAAGSARRKKRPPSAARRASAFSRREGARYRPALSAIERAVEGALPAFVEPELATLVKETPRRAGVAARDEARRLSRPRPDGWRESPALHEKPQRLDGQVSFDRGGRGRAAGSIGLARR